eukprot:TRINITY_DN309_c0_g1_i5.p1 TRINITY_DN309_c0_g1~~TRINITY_DN309_c0_g1_i5.p1  ORF type:complete len:194 (-),score=67.73 TRINITY_DN309_c0_g1_i5:102-683(-)
MRREEEARRVAMEEASRKAEEMRKATEAARKVTEEERRAAQQDQVKKMGEARKAAEERARRKVEEELETERKAREERKVEEEGDLDESQGDVWVIQLKEFPPGRPVLISVGEKLVYSSKKSSENVKRAALHEKEHVKTLKVRRQGTVKDDIQLHLPADDVEFTRPYKFADGLYVTFEWQTEGLCISQSECAMD